MRLKNASGNEEFVVMSKQIVGRWVFEPRNEISKAVLRFKRSKTFTERDLKILSEHGVCVVIEGDYVPQVKETEQE